MFRALQRRRLTYCLCSSIIYIRMRRHPDDASTEWSSREGYTEGSGCCRCAGARHCDLCRMAGNEHAVRRQADDRAVRHVDDERRHRPGVHRLADGWRAAVRWLHHDCCGPEVATPSRLRENGRLSRLALLAARIAMLCSGPGRESSAAALLICVSCFSCVFICL